MAAALALLLLASAVPAAAESLKILFVGNSYTHVNNLPVTLAKLAASAPDPLTLEVTRHTVGGATLQRHWNEGKAVEAIRKAEWDYVVLQEQSLLGADSKTAQHRVAAPDNFLAHARLFHAEILKAGARTVFYLTWSRESFPEMQARLTEAYRAAARETSALLAPVGIAFQNARIGNPGIKLYSRDQSHPSPAGTYLAACVFYAVLTGRNPAGLTSHIVDDRTKPQSPIELIRLSDDEAAYLQKVAWRTVQDDPAIDPHSRR